MSKWMKRSPLLAAPILVLALGGAGPREKAADLLGGAYSPIATIAIPPSSANVKSATTGLQTLSSFDISYVDAKAHRYYLADRSNGGIDIIDTTTNQFIATAGVGKFVGIKYATGSTTVVNNDASGPNGVAPVGTNEVWAGDGDSTVKVINLTSLTVTDTISTGGTTRADELAHDPDDQLVAIANDAETPPYITFISTKPGHAILGKLVLTDATNGLEQPVYDHATGMIYVAVPQIGSNYADGAIRVIDPKTYQTVRDIPLTNCQPAGLTRGPKQQFLAGCGAIPAAPVVAPAVQGPGAPANTQILSVLSGKVVSTIPNFGGSDEVWYNPGNDIYLLGASNNPSGPMLGIVSAYTNQLIQTIPTNTSSHSVAADSTTNQLYVPIRPGAPGYGSACASVGCIAVFGLPAQSFETLESKLTFRQ